MRNGKRLSKLCAAYRVADDFIEKDIGIVVKLFHICTCKQKCRIGGTADVEIGSSAAVNAMEIACGNGRFSAFAGEKHSLRTQRNATGIIAGTRNCVCMGNRLEFCKKFDPSRDRKFRNFVQAGLG